MSLPLNRERAESFQQIVLEKLLLRIATHKADLFQQFTVIDKGHTGLVRRTQHVWIVQQRPRAFC